MAEAMQTSVGTDVARAADLLRTGEVVSIPTETVYGLAGNALDEAAVTQIFAAKNRPQFNPLIVHIADADSAFRYAETMPPAARRLAEALWPGPLTLLLPKKPVVPDLVTAGSPLVALRVPRHPLLQELLTSLDFPLAAPSANPSGYVSPTTAVHVLEQLGGRIPYILDGGACDVGLESSIVGFDGDDPVLYREGGVSAEMLETVLGVLLRRASAVDRATTTPGTLKSHYATTTPLYLGDVRKLLLQFAHEKCAVISFSEAFPQATKSFLLSPQKSLEEAARNLFATLRVADASGCTVILAEPAPEEGLGRAINDRLRRAQHLLKGM
jgi:L-threonylcarbamoyladenylate synthase